MRWTEDLSLIWIFCSLTNAFGNKDYVFQQDGAPAHTSNIVQNWAKENFKGFWAKEIWLQSSPDLNPMDYSI